MKKKRPQPKHENYERERLIGKGKYTVKVVNQPCIKQVGMLKDKSSKNICIHNKKLRYIQNKMMQNMTLKTVNVVWGNKNAGFLKCV